MREIHVNEITDAVSELCIKACVVVAPDIREYMEKAIGVELGVARQVLDDMIKNQDIAIERKMPICQDTGMVVAFLEIGQDVHIVGGNVADAVHEGVRRGYEEGFLRKSVVADPINRVNTKDNTPAVINYDIVPGDKLKITVAPKGFGSENMSRIAMLRPSDGLEGVKSFVLSTVEDAGGNPCPPIIVGVGIGGTFDKAALLAKKALLRPADDTHPDSRYAAIESELLESINALGIGPQGFGGRTTALAVKVAAMPTHIAGLPVAVNINCHVTRHITENL